MGYPRILFCLAILLSCSGAPAQTTATSALTSPTQIGVVPDTAALSVVNRAIDVMGGLAAWSEAGSAEAQVDIALGNLPSKHIVWSDDWSSGHHQYRRTDQSKSVAVVGTEYSRTLRLKDGSTKQIPSESSLATLALGYPASALAIALRRSDCHFTSRRDTTDPDANARVSQYCTGSAASGPSVRLEWEFSKSTGLPVSLTRPIRDILSGRNLAETIVYASFSTIDKLAVPSQLTVIKPNGAKENIYVTATEFTHALPSTTFNIQ